MKRFFVILLLCLVVCARHGWAQDDTGASPSPPNASASPNNDDDDPNAHFNPNKNVKQPRHHHDYVNVETWDMQAVGDSKADGQATLTCYSDNKDNMLLRLRHLPKHAMFTAWIATSMKPDAKRAGLGDSPFMFKTGNKDSIEWGRITDDCPLGTYHWIVIRMHPDDDPTDVDNSVVILKAHMVAH